MANPFMFLAPLNGTLAFQDRAGGGTLTGAGAVRYQAASGARTNWFKNPGLGSNATNWVALTATVTRTADSDFRSGFCAEVVAPGPVDIGVLLYSANVNVALSAQTITVGIDAKLMSGASDWKARAILIDATGSIIGSGGSFVNIIPTATASRYVLTLTAPTTVGAHSVSIQILRKTAAASTVRFSTACIEVGATAGDHFDGSTGGAWLDPITGILGTAHASPSVSQAAAWVEEGTTNALPNPSFETNTTGWAATSSTISRDTAYAYVGSASGKVVTSNATANEGIATTVAGVSAANAQTWTASVRLRGSGTVLIGLAEFDIGTSFLAQSFSSTITLSDQWVVYSFSRTLNNASTAYLQLKVITNVQQSTTFYLDAVQLEQKAYATSYCDGSIGTGYAWSGTAHASSSTRTKASIIVNETSRISSLSGSVVARMNRLVDSGARQHVFNAGNAGASTDYLMLYVEFADQQRIDWRMNNGSAEIVSWGANNVVNTWYDWCADWNGTATGLTLDAGTRVAGTRTTPTTLENASKEMYIGSSNSGGGHLNGGISNVAIFDRPLTAKERATIYARASLVWGMLRSGFRHGRIV